jgi:fibronectin-binding autotransporter adhesin
MSGVIDVVWHSLLSPFVSRTEKEAIMKNIHQLHRRGLFILSLIISLSINAASLTWDITDTVDQTINDGAGTWNTSNPLWNDATLDNANVAWDNTANASDTAVIGAGGLGVTNFVTVGESISLAGLTFNEVTNACILTGGSLTAPSGTLTIQNNDTGADRRLSTGASIGSLLTGNMNVVFSGSGDNVGLTNAANDFVGELRLNGGGISIASNGALGNTANDLAVLGAGSTLRNWAAITVNRKMTFSAGAGLGIVNSGNILTLAGNISGGDSAASLTIGAGHGNSYNHTVRITGTNTMAGTIRIYNMLRAYEGVGLSTNANIKMGDYLDYGTPYANTCGFLETSGDFVRALGTGANQFQWESSGNYKSGGFSAVGDLLTINFGGLSTPASLTWNTTAGFLKTAGELRLQNANATHDLVWKNPVNLAAVRVIYANSSAFPAIMEGVLSGTGSSGISKEGVGILRLSATNTYAGVTTIAAGTLEAGALANGGSNSSIGKSANAAANLVFGAPTATLRYIGSADVTVDRGFTTSSGAGGGATLESSGTGALTLSSSVAMAYGTADETRTLTLGGTNVGANTFAKTISNNGTAAVSLTKAGTGRWVVSGDNSFTNVTTINAGVLRITHANALGTTDGNTTVATAGLLELAGGIATTEPLILQGVNAAVDADRIINVSGNNTLSGNFSINTGGTCYGFRSDANKLTISGNIVKGTATSTRTFYLRGAGNGEISGVISGTGYTPAVIKEGAGTWTLSGTNSYSGLTTVSNGTLAVGCDLALKAGNALTLSGGTFDAGSFSNRLGILTLGTGSTNILALNTGTCQLSFSGLSDSGTLTITGTLGPTTLRFGTSSTALPPEQRAQITTAIGRKIGLDANGYVFSIPPGTRINFY